MNLSEKLPRLLGQLGSSGSAQISDAGELMPDADVSHISRKWLDVPYATTSPAQRLDIYLPERGEGPFPVILFIHGGAFMMGDKRDFQISSFLGGLERGYAVVGINYRLSGEAVFPAGLQDVKAAVRWLRARAGTYLLDQGRIAACGESSGANFAAMIGATEGVALFDDSRLGDLGPSAGVQAVVDWFGPTDFLKMDEQLAAGGLGPCDHGGPDSPESRYLGAPIGNVPQKVQLANPMTYVDDRMPPTLIQHGALDAVVPFQQSVELAQVIEERAGSDRCELDIIGHAVHADQTFRSADNMARVFAFLDRHLV